MGINEQKRAGASGYSGHEKYVFPKRAKIIVSIRNPDKKMGDWLMKSLTKTVA